MFPLFLDIINEKVFTRKVANIMKIDWVLFGQYLSFIVGIVSAALSYRSVKSNNRSMEKLELTKEEFARENEKIKREQFLQDEKFKREREAQVEKQKLIAEFLSSINVFSATKTPELQERAVSSCSTLLPHLSGELYKTVNNIMKDLNDGTVVGWDTDKLENINQSIAHASEHFLTLLKQSN